MCSLTVGVDCLVTLLAGMCFVVGPVDVLIGDWLTLQSKWIVYIQHLENKVVSVATLFYIIFFFFILSYLVFSLATSSLPRLLILFSFLSDTVSSATSSLPRLLILFYIICFVVCIFV